MVIKIPTLTGGYVNIGDGIVLVCGFILGPVGGALAAGIGSMLADLIGYPIYAGATFVIKALMAFSAWGIVKLLRFVFRKHVWITYFIAGVVAEAVMILGYFVFEATVMSYGLGAVVSVPANMVQGGVGIAVAIVLMAFFERTNLIEKMMKREDKHHVDRGN